MHDTAYVIGGLVLRHYCPDSGARILEIGAQSINGSLRDHAPKNCEYVGLDIEEGPGVDQIIEAGRPLPVDESSFDLIIASSVFEHDDAFWLTFLEMCRKADEGGFIYLNVPSNGAVHRYPSDNWRFYPDAGRALAAWANRSGVDVWLVESFVSLRRADQWNDFVAIFRRGARGLALPQGLVCDQIECANIVTYLHDEVRNPSSSTEDQQIIEELRKELRSAVAEYELARGELDICKVTMARESALREVSDFALGHALAGQNGSSQNGEGAAKHDDQLAQGMSRSVREELTRLRVAEAELAARDRIRAEAQTLAQSEISKLRQQRSALEQQTTELLAELRGSERCIGMLAKKVDRLAGDLSAKQAELKHSLKRSAHEGDTAARKSAEQSRDIAAITRLLERAETRAALADRQKEEITTLTALLSDIQLKARDQATHLEKIKSILNETQRKTRLWGILPGILTRRKLLDRLERRQLFSAKSYLRKNPDVALAGDDPLAHYLAHGLEEGRQY